MFKILNLSFIVLVFLAGCSLKPPLPQVKTDVNYTISSVEIKDEWWRDFNDEVLNQLINEALLHNSDIRLAFNNTLLAREALGLSRSDFLPNISLSGSAQREKNNTRLFTTGEKIGNSFNIGAVLSYEIDLWGKVANSAKASEANFNATKFDYENARLSISSAVATSYFQLISLQQQELILQNTANSYTNTLKFTQNQFNAGAVNEINVYQAKSQLDSALAQMETIKSAISSTRTALALLVGKSFDDIVSSNLQTSGKFANVPVVVQGIPSDFLLRRPDVAASLERLKASNFLIGVARAQYFPTISLTGMFGFASGELDRLFAPNTNTWNIGGALLAPLLDFGRTTRRVNMANLDQNRTLIEYEKSLKRAFADTKTAIDTRKNAILVQESYQELLKTQEKVYKLAKTRYEQGYSPQLELLDAQRQLLNAQLLFVKSKADLLVSTILIYKALGGGFKAEVEKATSR